MRGEGQNILLRNCYTCSGRALLFTSSAKQPSGSSFIGHFKSKTNNENISHVTTFNPCFNLHQRVLFKSWT